MREELWEFGDDYASTGGKFREEKEETPEEKAFNKAALKKAKNSANVKSNKSALGYFIKKMQDKSVNIGISSDTLMGHYRTHDNQDILQHTDNFSILIIDSQRFLMKLNDAGKIHITKKPVDPRSGRLSYEECFENNNTYNTLYINDESSVNKWVWGILNSAIKSDSFPHLKPFLNYYN